MGRPAITYKRVLEVLNKNHLIDGKWERRYWEYNIYKGCEELITYREFMQVIMLREITTNERKVKELWEQMHTLGFFRKANKTSSLMKLDNIAEAMGYPINIKEPAAKQISHKTESEEAEECSAL